MDGFRERLFAAKDASHFGRGVGVLLVEAQYCGPLLKMMIMMIMMTI